jgi:hypothetical protein
MKRQSEAQMAAVLKESTQLNAGLVPKQQHWECAKGLVPHHLLPAGHVKGCCRLAPCLPSGGGKQGCIAAEAQHSNGSRQLRCRKQRLLSEVAIVVSPQQGGAI